MNPAFDIDTCEIDLSKHFRNKYMRQWNWDVQDIRKAIKIAYRVEKIGKKKYEAYVRSKGGSKKLIFVYYAEFDCLYMISASEGR